MMINALNSGARVFMCDFEDACSPTWANIVDGQRNLRDAVRRTISIETPEKCYTLNEETAVLVVRPRGWHLEERHVTVGGEPVSASLFDFALAFFHNAPELLARGSGPYFYLPKLENHEEAQALGPRLRDRRGGARSAVGLHPLHRSARDDPGGVRDGCDPLRAARVRLRLNAGRWDYIFSDDQEVRRRPPARSDAGDDDRAVHARVHRAARALVPCPRRARDRRDGRVHPLPARPGGERARSPGSGRTSTASRGRLRWDVGRPSRSRPVAMEVFDAVLGDRPNQLERMRDDVEATVDELLDFEIPGGEITEKACAPTSRSECCISTPGSTGPAQPRSTT